MGARGQLVGQAGAQAGSQPDRSSEIQAFRFFRPGPFGAIFRPHGAPAVEVGIYPGEGQTEKAQCPFFEGEPRAAPQGDVPV